MMKMMRTINKRKRDPRKERAKERSLPRRKQKSLPKKSQNPPRNQARRARNDLINPLNHPIHTIKVDNIRTYISFIKSNAPKKIGQEGAIRTSQIISTRNPSS
jgi:hypothetical protein